MLVSECTDQLLDCKLYRKGRRLHIHHKTMKAPLKVAFPKCCTTIPVNFISVLIGAHTIVSDVQPFSLTFFLCNEKKVS